MAWPFDEGGLKPAPVQPGAPGVEPGFEQWKKDRGTGPQAGGDDVWYAQTGNEMIVRNGAGKDPLLKIADVMWRFYRWSDKQVQALAEKLTQAGLLPGANVTRDTVWDAYRTILMEGAQQYAANKDKAPTIQQLLNKYMKNPVGEAGEAAKPKQYTQSAVNFTDPTAARQLLQTTLTDQLGRAPTEAEESAFTAALHESQKANPNKTKYTLNEETGQYDTSVASGGVDVGGFAAGYAQDDPALQKERGAYQMATTYMDGLMAAVGATVA